VFIVYVILAKVGQVNNMSRSQCCPHRDVMAFNIVVLVRLNGQQIISWGVTKVMKVPVIILSHSS